jgi:lipopolysaccharide biosynthesis glycosyltransferase
MTDTAVVIAVNRKDLWFCRICVASVRYFYPEVPILLLKDELNGAFSTRELEEKWNVEAVQFPRTTFGWSAAKIHFYCDQRFKGRRFLVLDADIVFSGKILDRSDLAVPGADVIVSDEQVDDPDTDWFRKTYFDHTVIQKFDPDYTFPGFTFNCGQLFCKGGFLDRSLVEPYFDFDQLPSWKRLDVFPLVDQSVFNYLLPTMHRKGQLELARARYMLWSETDYVRKMDLHKIREGNAYPYLIHWAGALRTPYLRKMTAPEVLVFFERYYYQRIFLGSLRRITRKIVPVAIYLLREIYGSLRRKLRRK